MKRLRLAYLIVFSISVSLTALVGCKELKGLNVGGYQLDPVVSAGEKLINAQSMSQEAEIDVGTQMAATLVGASALDTQHKQQAYVAKVGKWLSLHSSRSNIPWKFGILQDDDINAFAAPGGYVFITSGMLAILESEAELAGVLAHEITHVTEKHHLKAVQKDNVTGAASDILLAVTDHHLAQTGGQYQGLKQDVAEKLVSASRTLYARGLDRTDEHSADNGAAALLQQAGYDPWAYIAVLQKLDARVNGGGGMALLLKTHPTPETRIKKLSEHKVYQASDTVGATLATRFQSSLQ